MSTPQVPTTAGFDDLLRRILIVEKLLPLTDVAAALGTTAHGFCRRLRNGGRFGPDEVATLLRVVADERLPQWLFAGSGLLLVRHQAPPPDRGNMTLRQRTVSCAGEAISAICELADTLEASMLEGQQRTAIEEHLDRVHSGLLSIRLRLASPAVARVPTPAGAAAEDFGHLVRRVLLTGHATRPQLLAELLHLSYHALHARLTGQVAFLPAELRQLLRMFPDPRFADYLLCGTPYTAIPRPAGIDPHHDGNPVRTGLRSLREIVQFLAALLLVEQTGDATLRQTADRHLGEAVRQVATLRWNMTYLGPPDLHTTPAAAMQGFSSVAKAYPNGRYH